MADVSVKIDQKQIRAQLTGPSGAVALDLLKRGQRVENKAKQLCPKDTSKLAGSIAHELRGAGETMFVRVGSNMEYAIYVHEGTGIYAGKGYIFPKKGRYLRWPGVNNSGKGRRRYKGGKTDGYIYAKKVKGIKGRPFLKDALDAAK